MSKDSIYRDALAEEMCKAICGEERNLCVSTPRNCHQRCMVPIYAAPIAQPEPGWISVKDRLPENRGEVLLAVKIAGLPYIRVGWYGHMDGRWYFLGAGRAKDVTHWMPLPEPPEEEK